MITTVIIAVIAVAITQIIISLIRHFIFKNDSYVEKLAKLIAEFIDIEGKVSVQLDDKLNASFDKIDEAIEASCSILKDNLSIVNMNVNDLKTLHETNHSYVIANCKETRAAISNVLESYNQLQKSNTGATSETSTECVNKPKRVIRRNKRSYTKDTENKE